MIWEFRIVTLVPNIVNTILSDSCWVAYIWVIPTFKKLAWAIQAFLLSSKATGAFDIFIIIFKSV